MRITPTTAPLRKPRNSAGTTADPRYTPMQSASLTSPKPMPSTWRMRKYTSLMRNRNPAAPSPATGHCHHGADPSTIMSGRPSAATGRMTMSGMILFSRSTWLTSTRAETNSRCGTSSHERPSMTATAANRAAVSASPRGYLQLIGAPQSRHFPRSSSQLTSGTLS